MEWQADRSLQLRMGLTLAFVLLLPFAFAYALLFLLNTAGLELLEFATERPWNGEFYVDPLALAGGVTLGFLAQYALGERVALRSVGARSVDADERPDLHAALTRLSSQLDVPVPDLSVSRTDVPNAFTVGRSPDSATVVVTTGLLDRLDGAELDAVLAHELAHLRNRDAAVMTLATFLPALANDEYSLFSDAGGPARTFALGVAAVGGYAVSTTLVDAPPFGLESLLAFAGLVVFTALFGGVALGLLALPVIVLNGRLSRYREFAADRAGALLAGDPAAMASALETLDEGAPAPPTEDARASGVRELCFLPHGIVRRESTDGGDPLAGLPVEVETHPSTSERVARLRDLAAEGRDGYR